MTSQTHTVLHISSSLRKTDSITRTLTSELVEALSPAKTVVRDLADGIGQMDEVWTGATFTPEEDRSEEQTAALAESDILVEELKSADTLVIGVPVYNFSIAANLKNWVDLVSRARVTFRYSENGPEGLLTGKKAYLVYAAGGTAMGSDIDFATGYLRHVLGFIGITDVTIIAAAPSATNSEDPLSAGRSQIAEITGKSLEIA